ncbi:hypothetical protein [Weissella hellenica]|uniref:hypothetical protein n=1 Tax=Weissella hellenica TaxID=46256 RepID=UPI003883784C
MNTKELMRLFLWMLILFVVNIADMTLIYFGVIDDYLTGYLSGVIITSSFVYLVDFKDK